MSLGEPEMIKRGAKRIFFCFGRQFSMQGWEEGILDPGFATAVLKQIHVPF